MESASEDITRPSVGEVRPKCSSRHLDVIRKRENKKEGGEIYRKIRNSGLAVLEFSVERVRFQLEN